jgi:hypothetical protein
MFLVSAKDGSFLDLYLEIMRNLKIGGPRQRNKYFKTENSIFLEQEILTKEKPRQKNKRKPRIEPKKMDSLQSKFAIL